MDQYTLKDGRNRVRLLVFYCFTFFKFELNIKDSIVVNYMTFGDWLLYGEPYSNPNCHIYVSFI